MLFNSSPFIFLFLPVTLVLYFLLNRYRLTIAAKACLVLASLFFYGYWNPVYLPLIIGSIIFNYAVGASLSRRRSAGAPRKAVLVFGIAMNLCLLGYFKYTDFFITNINYLTAVPFDLLHIVLPLGISFFTFTQIAYLVDAFRHEVQEYDYLNYSLFVTFFPHLLAGPIIHHKEMMPQFDLLKSKILNYKNLAAGLLLFFIGLFKKSVIADTFGAWANVGFDIAPVVTFVEAWGASLSYTFQIYFDFSGYTDMALGSALMFNIKLPINFDSPYKSQNIQEFWRRWHVTLSRFLRDYVYIPLGGNKAREPKILANLMVTFLIGGIWHGAGWNFMLWGFLHGAAMIMHRLFQKTKIRIYPVAAWFITFNFINLTWIVFRAKTWDDVLKIIEGMIGMNGFILPAQVVEIVPALNYVFQKTGVLRYLADGRIMGMVEMAFLTGTAFIFSVFYKNTNQLTSRQLLVLFLLTASFSLQRVLFSQAPSEFLYFRF